MGKDAQNRPTFQAIFDEAGQFLELRLLLPARESEEKALRPVAERLLRVLRGLAVGEQ